MPFYEYQCKNCGHELEAMQKISEAPLKKCPHCGKSQLQRLISAPVFRLKGGGWYETDFKDDKDKKRNLADSPDSGKSSEVESATPAKGSEDSKAATKTDVVASDTAKSKSEDSAKTSSSKTAAKKAVSKRRPAAKKAKAKAKPKRR